jgi:hypothetical protein
MSRPRLPNEVARITGADKRSPGRFAGRSAPKVRSLGNAPARFTEGQKEIWNEFNFDFPWLGRSDRRLVGLAVLLQSQIDDPAKENPVAVFAQMRMLLSSMGGTPIDRSRVTTTEAEAEDPSDEFLQ